MAGPTKKSATAILGGGNSLQDSRPLIESDGSISKLSPPAWLPVEVRKEFLSILNQIKKNSKARAAFSASDREMLIVAAVSFATYRKHTEEFFSGRTNIDKKWLTREMGKLQADLRNSLAALLLTPNSRARVVVSDDAGGATELDDFLKLE